MGEKFTEVPTSWVEKIVISAKTFASKVPSGYRTTVYENAVLEIFAEYARPDGMIGRLTLHAETADLEVRESFANRRYFSSFLLDYRLFFSFLRQAVYML